MNVDAILVSEYATLTDGGHALTVVRCFTSIATPNLPARLPMMAVSIVIHAHFAERGSEHEYELRLLNQRREQIGGHQGMFRLPPGGEESKGVPLRHTLVSRFANVVFPEPGPYAFELLIDGTYHAAAAFYVELGHGQR
jgi:hypothetical protein